MMMMMIGESGGQNGGCKTVKNKNQRSAKKTTRNTTLSRASLSLLSFNLLLPFAFHAGKDVRHDHDRSRADYDDARVSSLPEREEGIFRFLASSRREREDRLLSIADGNDPPSRGPSSSTAFDETLHRRPGGMRTREWPAAATANCRASEPREPPPRTGSSAHAKARPARRL